jgi:hypothetical protein
MGFIDAVTTLVRVYFVPALAIAFIVFVVLVPITRLVLRRLGKNGELVAAATWVYVIVLAAIAAEEVDYIKLPDDWAVFLVDLLLFAGVAWVVMRGLRAINWDELLSAFSVKDKQEDEDQNG